MRRWLVGRRRSTSIASAGATQPSIRTLWAFSALIVTIADRLSLANVIVRASSGSSPRTPTRSCSTFCSSASSASISASATPKASRSARSLGNGVMAVVEVGDGQQDRDVLAVQRLGGQQVQVGLGAGFTTAVVGQVHHALQVASVASEVRSLARQRPRVGPMLPTGMPSAFEMAS